MLIKDLIVETKEINPLQDLTDDNSIAQKTDTRKTRLTLEQISKLRKLNDIKINEYQSDLKDIKSQYGAPAAEPVV